MTVELLTQFFMWCTLLNVAFLILPMLAVAFGLGGDFVYRMHSKWFPMPRETFNAILYLLIGVYKIFVFVFNLVPWIVLSIIA